MPTGLIHLPKPPVVPVAFQVAAGPATAGNTMYSKALSAAITFVAGQEYAWAPIIIQTAGVTPQLGCMPPTEAGEGSLPPRVNGTVSGITDIPAGDIAAATPTPSGLGLIYARFS